MDCLDYNHLCVCVCVSREMLDLFINEISNLGRLHSSPVANRNPAPRVAFVLPLLTCRHSHSH